MACRDTLAAGLITRTAGLHPTDPNDSAVASAGLRHIKVAELESLPATVLQVEAGHIQELHGRAVAQAWQDGAWDVLVTLHSPLAGPELGLVSVHTGWTAAEPIHTLLLLAARRGRLATWLWRPMVDGPAIRRSAHIARDTTLCADGGRDGGAPLRRALDWTRPAWSECIRLGRAPERKSPRPRPSTRRSNNARPATVRQLAYIAALCRRLELIEDRWLPPGLTSTAASRTIDYLQGGR